MTGTFVLARPEADRGLAAVLRTAPAVDASSCSVDASSCSAVPEALVHRSSHHDVLPTGHRRLSETHLQVTVHWAAGHRFYAPAHRTTHHALLVPETMRQTAIYLAHTEFEVPLGQHFVMWNLEFAMDQAGLAQQAGGADLVVDFHWEDVVRRGRQLAGLTCRMVISRDGQPIAAGGGRITCTSPGVYRRLRGERMAALGMPVPALPAVAPQTVGWREEADVFLAPTEELGRWQLRVNTEHPTLFNRPNDHVPGMLLLEAAAQAATASSVPEQLVPVQTGIEFFRYAELDEPCWITAEPQPATATAPATVVVTGEQGGEPVFRAVFTKGADRDRARA
ncbi:ScbA protein [Streptomyces tateyamensis]|uniref:ScbA protein n=1 Tax=Streptomyces tateyamensis TaxID=565073 RepID=A0A2V4NF99_9ACTN|nr:ScbA/BarX family gamma-butyrolactone biosynthesis protein [Streptomyces tateyamensis]PYC83769.1 ScbA protein [Streptomyces tateyamensis]